jgi:hypothetical protein
MKTRSCRSLDVLEPHKDVLYDMTDLPHFSRVHIFSNWDVLGFLLCLIKLP